MTTPHEKQTQELYNRKREELKRAYGKVKTAGEKLDQIEQNVRRYDPKDINKAINKFANVLTEYRKAEERVEELAKKLGLPVPHLGHAH